MNNCTFVGRLTRDVEIKKVGTKGTSLVDFQIAVNDPYNKEQADFIPVQAWGNIADFVGNYLGVGSLVSVVGSLKNNNYEKDGKKVYGFKVVASNIQGLQKADNKTNNTQNTYEQDNEPVLDIKSDDLPF